jgi:thiamine-phosphate pyrophosphorylase
MIRLPRLYAVADATFGNPVEVASALFAGGARLVQIRHKSVSDRALLEEVETVLKLAPDGAHVIVNDRCDIARLSRAAGVHLGQTDLSPSVARRILTPDQLVGRSTHTVNEAAAADSEPVDYIAVGPVFATSTKTNAAPVLGLERLREICSMVRKPVVAIGGITLESALDVLRCGAASVAVIGDLLKRGNIEDRARAWVRHLEC